LTPPIELFSGRRYINLESYKKSGEAKVTPVQSLEHDGVIYVRTSYTTWKVKRIRQNSRVRVAPTDRRGKPTGPWIEGEARVLEGQENQGLLDVFRKEYGAIGYRMVGLVGRMRGEEEMNAIISIKLAG
jgi:PPOX class probable F420-dependent enzyme